MSMYAGSLLNVKNLLGRRTLIVGDIGSGKTRLTARVLEEFVKMELDDYITVIDMAPEPVGNIGGKLCIYTTATSRVRYLVPEIVYTPRLSGKSKDEIITLAVRNAMNIKSCILEYLQAPSPILILNDLSMYLHAGDLVDIIECIEVANTFVGNGYYGTFFSEDYGSGISVRERVLMECLMRFMDSVYRL